MSIQEQMRKDNIKFAEKEERNNRGYWLDDIPTGLTPRQLSAAIHDDTAKYRLKGFKSIRSCCKGVMPSTANEDGQYER